MGKYAQGTDVTVAGSRDEIERTLRRYGATGFGYAQQGGRAAIQFEAKGRRVRFILPLPDPQAKEFVTRKTSQYSSYKPNPPEAAAKKWEQACRQKWRALALAIKAKLEAVESGITEFETEFMPYVVLPSGQTVAEWMAPQIADAYANNTMPPMLPGPAN